MATDSEKNHFWYPRTLLGIERHLLAFYDLPDVLHEMNRDLTEFNLRAVDRVTELLTPDLAVIAEDMSYNHGPMLSKEHFDEFMAPYYRRTTAKLKEHDIPCMVDSDGNIMPCASWFLDVGAVGFEPLERQAGIDIVELRQRHPDFRVKALMMRLAPRPDKVHEAVAVFECELRDGEVADPVQIEPGGDARPGKIYLEFCQYRAAIGDANQADMTTVDVLNPDAADAFLECTYAKYADRVGEWFGSTVPGIFTDEPQYRTGRRCDQPALPWTERLPEHFRSMHGYDLTDHLPSLFFPLDKHEKVRVDFWRCVTDLFVQNWSKRIYDWCDRRGLKLTGHVMEEDTLTTQIDSVGACMPHYEYFHIPGLDQLGREAPPWMRGDRGLATILTVKQVSSVAAQLGRPRVFCECYAVSGHLAWLQRSLLDAHRDYDLADETHIEKYGKVEGDVFVVGECRYRAVVLPAAITWSGNTLKMLSEFLSNGGIVAAVEPLATMVDGEESSELADFTNGIRAVGERDRDGLLEGLSGVEKRVEITGEGAEHVWVQLRDHGEQQALFLANTSREETIDVSVSVEAEGGCQEWNLFTGEVAGIPSHGENGRQTVHLTFPPVGSHLIVVDASEKPCAPAEVKRLERSRIELGDSWQLSRQHPNALNMDYCRVNIDNRGWGDLVPVVTARQSIVDAGYGSQYSLQYSFRSDMAGESAGELDLVVESPERFQITVNGRPVKYEGKGYWIDPGFKRIDIRKLVAAGNNVVEIHGKVGIDEVRSAPLWAEEPGPEVEDCYVIGDFAVSGAGDGFALIEEPTSVTNGDLVTQGYPFYPGTISLSREVQVDVPGTRSFLELEGLHATVAGVSVNGREAGAIFLRPHRVEITEHLVKGKNTICVDLANTLRNLLGPLHHVDGELGWVFQESFLPVGRWWGTGESQWTDHYNFVPLGFAGAHLTIEQR